MTCGPAPSSATRASSGPLPVAGFDNVAAMFVAAESTKRTVELDMASLETVIAGAAGLAGHQYLSVNLAPRTLETEAFNPFELLALCRRHDIAPSRIVVELTEREAVEDMGRLREALTGLRRHGMRTAADDVGAGNAGLRLLTEVDFDMMKIDLSLVRAGAATGTSERSWLPGAGVTSPSRRGESRSWPRASRPSSSSEVVIGLGSRPPAPGLPAGAAVADARRPRPGPLLPRAASVPGRRRGQRSRGGRARRAGSSAS